MPLDVIQVHGFGDAGLLIEIEQIAVQIRIIQNAAQIAFEMTVINRVETHQRAKQSPVGFHNARAEKITARRQSFLQFVQRVEHIAARSLVNFLRGSKACAINAVVHFFVNEFGKRGLFGGDVFGEKVGAFISEFVEGVVEHFANVVFGIIDDLVGLLVPQNWNRDASVEFRIRCQISFAEKFEIINWVATETRPIAKSPAAFVANRVDGRDADD